MHVQIARTVTVPAPPLGEARMFQAATPVETFEWALVKTDGTVICQGPHDFASEKECRSQIAEAKKSMKGASRCKVVSP